MIYAIINISSLINIDFNQIGETSKNTIRKSVDESKFVIKYNNQPTFIKDGTVIPLQILTHKECLQLMETLEWSKAIPEE